MSCNPTSPNHALQWTAPRGAELGAAGRLAHLHSPVDHQFLSQYALSVLTLDHSPVHSNPKLMGGTLVFRGTRVPAQTLLDYLDDSYSVDEFLDMFPSVQRSDADEFLRLARGPSYEGDPGREPAQAA